MYIIINASYEEFRVEVKKKKQQHWFSYFQTARTRNRLRLIS